MPPHSSPRRVEEPADERRALESRIAELEGLLAIERERAERRQRLHSLVDELARLRMAHPVPRSEPSSPPPAPESQPSPGEAVLVDAPLDTRWAHPEPRLARCVHIFHQEWSGIRAAAGFSPGRKVAITADRRLTPAEHQRILEFCEQARIHTVFFQGFSQNTAELLPLMRRAFGGALRLLAVWHGSTTQFHFPAELDGLSQLLSFRKQGLLDGLVCVKPQMHVLSELIFPLPLLNLPPLVSWTGQPGAPRRAALIPTPNNWWKNFYTNLLVAASSPRLSQVYVTTQFETREELPLRNQVVNVGRLQRAELFQLIPEVDVLFNVTLTECQPMTALEGMAFGVPCLTGPLSLGELDRHPYQRLVQVPGTGSLVEIQTALEHVLELRERSPLELDEMIRDFARSLEAEAIRRYLEFSQS